MNKIRLAIIGMGGRGNNLWRGTLQGRDDILCCAICDTDPDFWERDILLSEIEKHNGFRPNLYENYNELFEKETLDAVIIATGWRSHIEISICAMEHGVAVGCEVGGAYSIDSLWELVHCWERTHTPIMLLENCCWGRMELLALNMKRLGLLGRIVHCEGGYHHDLRWIAQFPKCFRIYEYLNRNSENYPTHELGPIAKLLDINCGNRFESLMSMGSAAWGLKEYFEENHFTAFQHANVKQSDIVTTLIRCSNGETITITLDTSLPRYYSRGFTVHGTKGLIVEENQSVYLQGDPEELWSEHFNNINSYYEKYDHPIWKDYNPRGGHGGMDWLMMDAFLDAVKNKKPMPIDVYDMAALMAVTALSEQSMVERREVMFPDFTNGKWIANKDHFCTEE